ncbi:Putative multidrug resistance protein MdtD [Streptomyces microflavus]
MSSSEESVRGGEERARNEVSVRLTAGRRVDRRPRPRLPDQQLADRLHRTAAPGRAVRLLPAPARSSLRSRSPRPAVGGRRHAREQRRLYTTVDDALRTAEALGLGEKGRYLLAASFGNVHGVYKPGNVVLRPELLKDLQSGVSAKYGKPAAASNRVVCAAPLRDRAERGGPHRRPGPARRRRGAAHAGVPGAHPGQFPSRRPGAGRGLWSGFGGVGAAVGPFVGGWLVDGPGWRWVFLLNLPLAAICVPVALRHVPESRDPAAHGRFDVLGAVLGALALAGVTYALIEAPGRGASPLVIGQPSAGCSSGWRSCWWSSGGLAPCCRRRSSAPGCSPRSTW